MRITLDDIRAAHRRIVDGIACTPCPESLPLSEVAGCRVFCKLDYLQRTGSFKERGARNALLQLDEAARARGVIAASAGNHALGLAYHGKLLGIPVTVVMPDHAPLIKVQTCRRLQARVVLGGRGFGEAKRHADALAAEEGLTYVHGYDDPAIIAGQGTIALEILDQVPDVDAVIAPIGGGGLLAGVATAIKGLRDEVRVIGVEAERAPTCSRALEAGGPVAIDPQPTLADGLAVPRLGSNAFEPIRDHLDRLVAVGEAQLAVAILRLLELEKAVVEGAAAAPLAACFDPELRSELEGKTVVLLLCGGNIDPSILSRVIEQGLVGDGRLCRFTSSISDRPGGLAAFTHLIASTGASIRDITHDRAFAGPDISAVDVFCVVETRDREHIDEVQRTLRDNGFPVIVQEWDHEG